MTNFEKFKQELTLEQLVNMNDDDFDCDSCPASDFCYEKNLPCSIIIEEWGNRVI